MEHSYHIPHLLLLFDIETKAISLIKQIFNLMNQYKQVLRPLFVKQYKHELLNNLFNHPYTKIEFVERDMMVSRQTASKYLDMITQTGLLQKIKMGIHCGFGIYG